MSLITVVNGRSACVLGRRPRPRRAVRAPRRPRCSRRRCRPTPLYDGMIANTVLVEGHVYQTFATLVNDRKLKPGFHPNATHATQAIAFGWKPGFSKASDDIMTSTRSNVTVYDQLWRENHGNCPLIHTNYAEHCAQ